VHLLDHDDPAVREGAVQVVVVGGGRDGIPRLRRALGDSSSGVRTAALWGLGVWCATEVKADLEARLQERTLVDVPATEKMALFEAYARIGAAAAVPLLARILLGRVGLRGRWPSDLRVCAARVLRLTQSPDARGHLEKATRDEDDGVRRAAQRALQRLEAPA
jgi:HEAT repeat protein